MVADGPEAAAGLEFGEDLAFEVIDLGAAGGVQADVDFSVRTDGGDVAFERFAGLEGWKTSLAKSRPLWVPLMMAL